MTQSKGSFTRGPLTVDERGIIRHTNKNGFSEPVKIASAWREGAWEGDPEAIANATLYAAAPALLDFAKALDASWSETFPDGPDADYSDSIIRMGDEHLALWRQCRAAIQSATGEG